MNDRLCSRCHRQPRKSRHSYCVECSRTYQREYARRKRGSKPRPLRPALGPGEKFCFGCERILPVSHFHRCRSKRDGRMSSCKMCAAIRYERWRARYPVEYLRERDWEYARRWRAKHPTYNRDYLRLHPRKQRRFARILRED